MIIDISHHQDPARIDYKKLCSQLKMAIIRVQYGSRTIDRHYKTHITQMKKYNIPFGVYAWVRGVNEKDMQKEAQDFYNRAKNYDPLFYVLDVEEKSMQNMRAGINAYVEKLRSLTTKKIGVYVAHHRYREFNLDLSKFDFIWIPRYGVNNGKPNVKPDFYCDLWQYTDKGKLDGYAGYLDLNKIMNNKTVDFFTGKKDTKDKTKLDVIKIKLHGRELEIEGIFKNKTNYIPVRFLEQLGYEVDWQDGIVIVDYKEAK